MARSSGRRTKPEGERAVSAQTAFLVSDILAGNTDPRQNDIWAEKLAVRNGPGGSRRPAAAKTGTTNDARDLGTYGFLPASGKDGVGLAVGVWMGNSDHSYPRPGASRDLADGGGAAVARLRPRLHQEAGRSRSSAGRRTSSRPRSTPGPAAGPAPWTRDTTEEWFIKGTQPGARKAIDRDGLLYRAGVWRLAGRPGQGRARTGGVEGGRPGLAAPGAPGRRRHRPVRLGDGLLLGESSWGGPLYGAC